MLAFYNFVRAADDVADNATAPPRREAGAAGTRCAPAWWAKATRSREGVALRTICAERGLTPQHALDLLEAFRRDCTKLRYATGTI